MAVFRAVIAGGDVETALAAAPVSYTDAWKRRVRDMLDNHNVGDIRIAMNGGSIGSDGDGIRAYYATQHADNGAISVAVAKEASVACDACPAMPVCGADPGERGLRSPRGAAAGENARVGARGEGCVVGQGEAVGARAETALDGSDAAAPLRRTARASSPGRPTPARTPGRCRPFGRR